MRMLSTIELGWKAGNCDMEIRWNYDGIRMEVGLKYDDAMEIGWK